MANDLYRGGTVAAAAAQELARNKGAAGILTNKIIHDTKAEKGSSRPSCSYVGRDKK